MPIERLRPSFSFDEERLKELKKIKQKLLYVKAIFTEGPQQSFQCQLILMQKVVLGPIHLVLR